MEHQVRSTPSCLSPACTGKLRAGLTHLLSTLMLIIFPVILASCGNPKVELNLRKAAATGDVTTVQGLINSGVNINAQERLRNFRWGPVVQQGPSALMLAAESGHIEVVKLLLGKRSDVDAVGSMAKVEEMNWLGEPLPPIIDPYQRRTALMLAAEKGHIEVARLLLDAGTTADKGVEWSQSPLTLAVSNGRAEIVRLLLSHKVAANVGTVINVKGRHMATVLEVAAMKGHTEIVKALVDNGANVNGRGEIGSEEGKTALIYAAENGHSEVVQVLVSKGADVNVKSFLTLDRLFRLHEPCPRQTALMFAAANGHIDAARLLILAGASLDQKNLCEQTALDLAVESKQEKMVEFLKSAGALK